MGFPPKVSSPQAMRGLQYASRVYTCFRRKFQPKPRQVNDQSLQAYFLLISNVIMKALKALKVVPCHFVKIIESIESIVHQNRKWASIEVLPPHYNALQCYAEKHSSINVEIKSKQCEAHRINAKRHCKPKLAKASQSKPRQARASQAKSRSSSCRVIFL